MNKSAWRHHPTITPILTVLFAVALSACGGSNTQEIADSDSLFVEVGDLGEAPLALLGYKENSPEQNVAGNFPYRQFNYVANLAGDLLFEVPWVEHYSFNLDNGEPSRDGKWFLTWGSENHGLWRGLALFDQAGTFYHLTENEDGKDRDPRFSPDDSKVVFVREFNDIHNPNEGAEPNEDSFLGVIKSIAILDLSTQVVTEIYESPYNESWAYPVWSPDGNYVAFKRWVFGSPTDRWFYEIIDLFGNQIASVEHNGEQTHITAVGRQGELYWADNSEWLAATLDGNSVHQIFTYGDEPERLTDYPEGGEMFNFELSPDGRKLVLNGDKGVFIYDIETTDLDPIGESFTGGRGVTLASWWPDSNAVALTRTVSSVGNSYNYETNLFSTISLASLQSLQHNALPVRWRLPGDPAGWPVPENLIAPPTSEDDAGGNDSADGGSDSGGDAEGPLEPEPNPDPPPAGPATGSEENPEQLSEFESGDLNVDRETNDDTSDYFYEFSPRTSGEYHLAAYNADVTIKDKSNGSTVYSTQTNAGSSNCYTVSSARNAPYGFSLDQTKTYVVSVNPRSGAGYSFRLSDAGRQDQYDFEGEFMPHYTPPCYKSELNYSVTYNGGLALGDLGDFYRIREPGGLYGIDLSCSNQASEKVQLLVLGGTVQTRLVNLDLDATIATGTCNGACNYDVRCDANGWTSPHRFEITPLSGIPGYTLRLERL